MSTSPVTFLRSTGPASGPIRVSVVLYTPPLCMDCGRSSRLADSPSHYYLPKVYACQCGAYSMAAADGRPLGRPASRATRLARRSFHLTLDRAVDFLGGPARKAMSSVYECISRELCIDKFNCHAGLFDEATCLEAIVVIHGILQGRIKVDTRAPCWNGSEGYLRAA